MGLYDDKTLLPAAAQRAIDAGDDRALIDALGTLPLAAYYWVAKELVWRTNWRAPKPRSSLWGRFRAWFSVERQVVRSPSPDLFHHSGYVREAALKRIDGPVPNAFFLVALVYRLNDWVPEVR